MLEDLEYIKKWCQQDHTGLSGYGVAQAVERMVDDMISKHTSVQATCGICGAGLVGIVPGHEVCSNEYCPTRA